MKYQAASRAFLILGLAVAPILAGCTGWHPNGQISTMPTAELIYFDSGSADLRPDARDKIRVVAEEAKQGHFARIQVAGFTDTVGSDAVNQQLSQRRAEAVASALEAMGVSRYVIAVSWHGKSELAMRTPDNTPNPENRRVLIMMPTS